MVFLSNLDKTSLHAILEKMYIYPEFIEGNDDFINSSIVDNSDSRHYNLTHAYTILVYITQYSFGMEYVGI